VTVVLTGSTLSLEQLVAVARDGERVAIEPGAIERMGAARAVVDAALERGEPVYGLTTGVGVLKRVPLAAQEFDRFDRMLLRSHRVASGQPAPVDVVRATMLVLANGYASGWPGVRPVLAEGVAGALNDGAAPVVRILGSVGQGDLAPMADLAAGLVEGVGLAPGEALSLVSNNAFSTGWAGLAVWDAARLERAMEAAGALSLEGFAANPTMLHPAIGESRPYPGLRSALDHLRTLLRGSYLFEPGSARNLQDPLTFRNLPHLQGAFRDALDDTGRVLSVELNASQGNPIVVAGEKKVISVANFEILPLAAALDHLRTVLASALTSANERVVKLLETPWSGLPTGLASGADPSDPGLAYLGIAGQALAAEARLLAQPVSFEMASTAHAEGIEDRTTMAPLAARRLAEMVQLGERIVAGELAVASQAAELRGVAPLGRGTEEVLRAVRTRVPFLRPGDAVPEVEGLTELIRSGQFAADPGR
jgi:histidine ammonia-lyase